MFVVQKRYSNGAALQALRKIPCNDAFIVVVVTVITVFTDLAIAVVVGVIVAALVFTWQHAKRIDVKSPHRRPGLESI